MTEGPFAAGMVMILHFLIQITLMVQVLLRSHPEQAARIAWVVVILVFPVLGSWLTFCWAKRTWGEGVWRAGVGAGGWRTTPLPCSGPCGNILALSRRARKSLATSN